MIVRGYRWGLVLVITAALVASCWLAGHRFQIESEYRQVEVAVSYDDVLFLAGLTDREPVEVLEGLRDNGATAVFFREQTLTEASQGGRFTVLRDGALRHEPWFSETGIEPSADDLYLVVRDERTFGDLHRQLQMKTGASAYTVPGGPYVIVLPVPVTQFDLIGVGFPAHGFAQAAAAGLNVIPQVRTWPGVTPAGLAALGGYLGEIPGFSAVAFNDPSLPGYPGLIHVLTRELAPLGVPVTDIEFYPQAGLRGVGRNLPARQVMLHSIPSPEMPRYTPTSAADRLVLAATERNAKVLLVRFFFEPHGTEDVWTTNAAYLEGVSQRLAAAGLTPGAPAAPAPWQPPATLVALIGLGAIAGGLFLWERLRLNSRLGPLLGLSAALAWGAFVMTADLNQAAKLAALAGVIVFPCLAVVTVVREQGVSVYRSVLRFAQAAGISLIGAAFLVGLLSDTGFMLRLDQFGGVKLAHAGPLLLLGLYFAYRPREGAGWFAGFRDLLERPVLVKYAVIGAVIAAAAAVYLLRTGNESALLVSSFEIKLRAALDQALVVRPRTKEFLLGHPWLLLLLFTGYRNARYLPLVALGAIGQISLVNTFAHLHTPLYVSLFRAFNGLWLGLIIGLVLIAAWYVVERRRSPEPVNRRPAGGWACVPEDMLRPAGARRRTGGETPGE
ncbi:MAG: hypothetical protein IBX71_03100 [Candidatus Desulforudis sp.]|nr:hypothetical protein [Desulforudis sp.]